MNRREQIVATAATLFAEYLASGVFLSLDRLNHHHVNLATALLADDRVGRPARHAVPCPPPPLPAGAVLGQLLELEFLDSSGIGVLVSAAKELRGGATAQLVLVDPGADCHRCLAEQGGCQQVADRRHDDVGPHRAGQGQGRRRRALAHSALAGDEQQPPVEKVGQLTGWSWRPPA